MEENKLPLFNSVTDLADFFDTHDMGEYMEHMPEVHFDVAINRTTHFVAIDEDVIKQVFEIAKSQNVSAEQLINTWVKERLLKAA
jgi:hypothetical protein